MNSGGEVWNVVAAALPSCFCLTTRNVRVSVAVVLPEGSSGKGFTLRFIIHGSVRDK